jgi:cysteine-rich repeat protein
VCGNGTLELGEACDDGAKTPGDGCSAACAVESGWGCDTASPSACSATHPSCAGMSGTECGDGGDCCASPPVTGGQFLQGSGTSSSFSSTVSSFRLDRYEVTVGRFRNFVSDYDAWHVNGGYPLSDDGQHPKIAATGWYSGWTLPVDATALIGELECDASYAVWATSGNDTLPIDCVDWFTAFAFCIWDGGRLPTESEWEYAAAGGNAQNVYPWGDTPVPSNAQDETAAYANYDCLGDGSAPGACAFGDTLAVGSKPAGRGAFDQEDIAGSRWEWVLDYIFNYPTTSVTDYAKVDTGGNRSLRGGSWYNPAYTLTTGYRAYGDPTHRNFVIGLRCARSL